MILFDIGNEEETVRKSRLLVSPERGPYNDNDSKDDADDDDDGMAVG